VILIDTAGLRRRGRRVDRLERGSAYMALRSIERADVVLLVIDVIDGITDQDAKLARLALDRGRPLILVLNKWDAVDPEQRRPEIDRQLDRKLGFVHDAEVARVSAHTGKGTKGLLERSLELLAELRRRVPTPEINRVLEEALERNAPPGVGRHRARFYYATQISDRPFTIVIFMNNPDLVPENYRRYLESFFRKRFAQRSAPLRVRLRRRRRADASTEG
jgi:GTP-binding protein